MQAYQYVTEHGALGAIAREVRAGPVVALDLETTGLDPYLSQVRLISLNTGWGVYVVDVFQTGVPLAILDAIRTTKAVLVLQNGKFDQKFFLRHWGVEFPKLFDTYRAASIIYNGKGLGNNLYDLLDRELGVKPEAEDLGASDWSRPILTQAQKDYAAEDVIWLPKLREVLKEKLNQEGLNAIALLEFQAILPEAAMELNGFPFDSEAWTRLEAQNKLRRDILEAQLLGTLPHPDGQLSLFGGACFNLGSHDQLLKSLRRMGVPAENTDAIALAQLAPQYPIVDQVLEFRGYDKAVDSFGLEFLRYVHPVTGRIHTSYYPFTGAGRYSSGKPNLQQVPRDKAFRKCFRALDGYSLVLRDYSQIELRIAAEIANETNLMAVYQRGEDAHTNTGRLLAGSPNISKEHRQQAKPVNFGFLYGMQAKKLVLYAQANYGVTFSLQQAEDFRNKYFAGYPGLKRWHGRVFSEAHRNVGHTRTVLGRRRYLAKDAYNEYANTPVQGSGADGLKISLRLVYDKLKKFNGEAQMIHMVHDEIICHCPTGLVKEVDKVLEEGMHEGMSRVLKKVPVVTEGGEAQSWDEK